MSYLLLEEPLAGVLNKFSLPLLYQGYITNVILLLPLLLLLIFLLFKFNLEKGLALKEKKVFLIPAAYLVLTVAMNFTAFKSAVSFDFIIFLFGLCLVGFTEEFMFRGIIFPKMTNAFSSVYIGALASSFLFGIGHYINLFRQPGAINEVTSQVIFAFSIGILMCGILYKTKNLIIPALIHTILNLGATIRTFKALKNAQIPVVENKDAFHPPLWEIVSQELGFILFCLISGFILIFHQKRKERITADSIYAEKKP